MPPPGTIVIVEDDASMSQAIERLLQAGGWTTRAFSSAESFLATPDLPAAGGFVIDLRLPGCSGVELGQHLRRSGSVAPFVFITAFDGPAVREAVARLAPARLLLKPFSGLDLMDAFDPERSAERPPPDTLIESLS